MSLRRNAAYAAPALPLAALYFPVYVYLAQFYAADRGVSLAALGGLFIAVRLVDAFSDPLMGYVSDRFETRFGRRKLWIAISVPLIAVSCWMVMVPPDDAGFGHVALWLTLLTLSWTVALTPYFAWGAELSGDYAERAAITGWREGVTLIGTIVAVILYVSVGEAEQGMRNVALFVV
ncbi:MAG: MFS transporter, partial [Pseudomonadota bacterium]